MTVTYSIYSKKFYKSNMKIGIQIKKYELLTDSCCCDKNIILLRG